MRLLLVILVSSCASLVSAQIKISSLSPFDYDTLTFEKRQHSFSKTAIVETSDTLQQLEFTVASESYFKATQHFTDYLATAGIDCKLQSKKWYSKTQVLFGYGTYGGFTNALPLFVNSKNSMWNTLIKSRTAFHPNRYLTIQAGIDNHFFGEGYRSLIQGDQVAPNPFASMQVKFLNLEYGLHYQFLHEQDYLNGKQFWKYMTSHYLSWNAFRNFNATLYESVIYQSKDGAYKRGYEVEYLNPFVFYRPQEYSLGSTDNVFMALNLSYKIKQHQLYFQVLLDEFDLGSIKKRTRWWANKYGVQLGVKGKITQKISYRLEGNLVRPYTFSHITNGQNTGNMGLPTGHYLGSNFAEILATANYKARTFQIQAYTHFNLKGFDTDSISWGGNIYQSYVNRPFEYGHYIGQGQTLRYTGIGGQFTYSLPFVGWDAYLQAEAGYTWGDLKGRFSSLIQVGVRTHLFNTRRIF